MDWFWDSGNQKGKLAPFGRGGVRPRDTDQQILPVGFPKFSRFTQTAIQGTEEVTATADVTVALTGVESTLSVGTLGVSITVPVTGNSTTVSVGTLTVNISVPITGTATTVSAGSLTPTTTVPVTGLSITGAVGDLTPSIDVALTGLASVLSAGNVTIPGDVTISLSGVETVLFSGDVTVTSSSDVTVPSGGSGYPVYWQGKRRKRKLEDQPLKHLEYILDKVVAEYYGDIISSDLPKAVKKEAAAVVKPFLETNKKGISTIDWIALQRDADAVGTILQIWHEELQQIEDEDEEFMMMH